MCRRDRRELVKLHIDLYIEAAAPRDMLYHMIEERYRRFYVFPVIGAYRRKIKRHRYPRFCRFSCYGNIVHGVAFLLKRRMDILFCRSLLPEGFSSKPLWTPPNRFLKKLGKTTAQTLAHEAPYAPRAKLAIGMFRSAKPALQAKRSQYALSQVSFIILFIPFILCVIFSL